MSTSLSRTPDPVAPRPGSVKPAFRLATSDVRADAATRDVSISSSRILIERRLQGVAMRIAVEARSYRGVALSLTCDDADEWRVTLVHRDPDLSIPLEVAADDTDILADWRTWSDYFALPALLEVAPGDLRVAKAGARALAANLRPAPRRRGRLLAHRRPRFLVRRKMGVPR